jgi:hypothetical protein
MIIAINKNWQVIIYQEFKRDIDSYLYKTTHKIKAHEYARIIPNIPSPTSPNDHRAIIWGGA